MAPRTRETQDIGTKAATTAAGCTTRELVGSLGVPGAAAAVAGLGTFGSSTDSTTGYRATTTTATSTGNVQGTTSTTEPGARPHETTTTTVTSNTDLHVTLRWTGSATREVTGHLVSSHLGTTDRVAPLVRTAGTGVGAVQDADVLPHRPSLLVTTETRYGWTVDPARTAVLSC